MNSNFLEPRLAAQAFFSGGNSGSGTVYSVICRWLVLAGFFLVPVFFLPWTTSVLEFNKQMLLLVLAGAGLILWLLDVVISGKLSWRPNSVDTAVASILGASVLATVFSIARFKSLMGLTGSLSESLVVIVSLSVFYFLAVHSFRDKGKVAITTLVASFTLALVYGALQLFGVYVLGVFGVLKFSVFDFTKTQAFNTVGSFNALGILAAVALPLLYRSSIPVLKYFDIAKIGTAAAITVLFILNWWVLWAVAIAGLASSVAFESLAAVRNSGAQFRISRFVFQMTMIVMGVFFMIVNFSVPMVKGNLPIEIAPSFSASGDIMMKVLKNNPAFGYGPENFSLAFDRHAAGTLADTTLSTAKFFDGTSQFFNFAVTGGVVMVVALAYLLWVLFGIILKGVRSSKTEVVSLGVASSLVAMIAALFLYPFNLTLMFTFYVLTALLVLAVDGRELRTVSVEEKATASLVSSLGFIGGLILVLVGVYFGATVYVSDIKYTQAFEQKEGTKAIESILSAINWNGSDDRYYRASSQVALGLLSEEISKKASDGQQARVQNLMASAVNLAKRATEIAPKESSNWSNLGSVYRSLLGFLDGADKLAEESYLKAADLRPGDASFYNEIGSLYLASSDLYRQLAAGGGANAAKFQSMVAPSLEKSEENFKKAIELSNNFGLAIYNLGVVYDRQGKLQESITQLEKIIPFNSNQPNLAFELGLLYYRAGQKDKAYNALQRAVILAPNFANARWYLALILEEKQQIEPAIEQLEKILASEENKNNETVLAKLGQLKSGKKAVPPQKVTDQKPIQ